MSAHTISVSEEIYSTIAQEAGSTGLDAQQWITELLTRHIELKRQTNAFFDERAARTAGPSIRELLSRVPDNPPDPGDELPEGWPKAE